MSDGGLGIVRKRLSRRVLEAAEVGEVGFPDGRGVFASSIESRCLLFIHRCAECIDALAFDAFPDFRNVEWGEILRVRRSAGSHQGGNGDVGVVPLGDSAHACESLSSSL